MKICIVKATKRIIEMQSGAREGALIQNAINGGYAPEDIEEREVDEAGYEVAKAEDPVEIATEEAMAAEEAVQAQKAQALTAAKARIAIIETDVGKSGDFDALKAVILDLVKQLKVLLN